MFQFSPLALPSLWIQEGVTRHDSRRVSPFGHPRITAYVRLPEAFRSLSRPSSPVHAKASTVRPCSLDRISAHASYETWQHRPTVLLGHNTLVLAFFSLDDLHPTSLYPGFQCNQDRRVPAQFVRLVS